MEGNVTLRNLFVLIFVFLGFVKRVGGAPPAVTGLPRQFYIGEAETGDRLIFTYAATGDTEIDCGITIVGTPTAAGGNEFETRQNQDSLSWELWTTGLVTWNVATTKLFTITVICTDNILLTSTPRDLTIRVVDNEQITEDSHQVTVDAMGTSTGANITTVTSTSTLGNDIVYGLATDPYFQIDPSSGIITSLQPLETIDTGTPSMILTVTSYDTTNKILVYNFITLDFTNQNTVPFTNTLPLVQSQAEDITSTTTLFTLVNEDPDSGQTFTYEFECNPSEAEDLFELTTGLVFRVKSGKSLDFETLTSITCDFYLWDGIEWSGAYTYTLTITDVNEAPWFTNSMYYGTLTEGAAGAQTINPGIVCNDVDSGDTKAFHFTVNNGSTRFFIHTTDANVSLSTAFDRETEGSEVVLGVLCEDSGGVPGTPLSGTTYITLTIEDVNDNAPIFTNANTLINIDDSTTVGGSIGTVLVTDIDQDGNGQTACNWTSTSPYASYFLITDDCKVYLIKTPNFGNDTQIIFDLMAVDGGSPQLSGTGILTISYLKTATTTTTTTTEYEFFDHSENYAPFVFALLAALILLGLLCYCLFRYCFGGTNCLGKCCEECRSRSRPRRKWRPRQSRRNSDSYYRRDSPHRKERPPTYDRYDRYDDPPYSRGGGSGPSNKMFSMRPVAASRPPYGVPPSRVPGYIG